MLLSRVLFSLWVSPPVPHGFLAGRIISKLSRQKACSVSNEQVRETSHPARGERLQRKEKKRQCKGWCHKPSSGLFAERKGLWRGTKNAGSLLWCFLQQGEIKGEQ